ncbi:P-loop containing nucleoside triphosphate hydrolase protein [Phycomyces blakesleeanus]|uniref:ATP-dependent RNA helicase n=2 Tax=Phycomyces blakesleeanus TaxID=4837 RepID=A0ABR3AX12_PHYBL
MFSISRYDGEDEKQTTDSRSMDKKQERLNKLLEKVNRKRKTEQPDTTITKEVVEKKSKKQPKKQNVVSVNTDEKIDTTEESEKGEEIEEMEEVVEEEDNEENDDKEEVEEDEEEEEEGKQKEKEEEEEDESILEAFPDMIGTQAQQSKEDIKLLRSMGIPEWLLQPTVVSPEETCELDQAGLSARIIKRCGDFGLSSFFAVQMAVIPVFLRRQTLYDTRRAPGDLCISAPTGSGKTLAYVLPIVDILSKRVVTRLRALIILPTRDLVVQVKETFDAFVQGTDLKVGTATGQQSFAHEQQSLVGMTKDSYPGGSSRVDILIATPGRLMDHLKDTPNFSLEHLRFLVIDEADRLLNQSFQDWLNQVLQATRPGDPSQEPLEFKTNTYGVPEADAIAPSYLRSHYNLPKTDLDLTKAPAIQKLLFSATLTKDPAKIAGLHLTDPEYISVQVIGDDSTRPEYTTPAGLKEHMVVCNADQKPLMMIYLLHQVGITSGLCFTKSVESTQRLQLLIEAYEELNEGKKTRVAEYSSDLSVSQRKSLMKKFRAGEIDLMICSDLIGRGIDLDCVDTVISYDVPLFMDKYIHRVGRTARAGREGQAYTIVEKQEARHFKEILRDASHLSQVKTLRVEKEDLARYEENYKKALASLKD